MSKSIRTSRGARKGNATITVCTTRAVQVVTHHEVIRAVRAALDGRATGAINVVLADDAVLASLHKRYMNDPRPTDVLTFDLRDDAQEERIEGEIVVSVQTARREAARRRIPVGQEVLRYVIHGTLHLLGYDDRTTAHRRPMRREENRVLAKLAKRNLTDE